MRLGGKATGRVGRSLINIRMRGLIILAIIALLSYSWIVKLLHPVPFKQMVEEAALEWNLDPFLLVAVMKVESGFDPRAVSAKGARGLMQIMPDTGAWAAVQLGMEPFHPDDLFIPDINLRIGAWYLSYLSQRFNDRLVLALAAYNGGQGNVQQWLTSMRWSGEVETVQDIPYGETRRYVIRVLRTYESYKDTYQDWQEASGEWESLDNTHKLLVRKRVSARSTE